MASTSKGGGSLEPPASGVPGSIPGQVILGGHEWPFDPDGSAGANDSGPPPPPQQQQQPPPTNPPPDLTSNEDENFASTLDMEAIKVSLILQFYSPLFKMQLRHSIILFMYTFMCSTLCLYFFKDSLHHTPMLCQIRCPFFKRQWLA